MAAELEILWDEATALEDEVQTLRPDPARLAEEVEITARELARLQAEVRALDGPARHRASLFVTSALIAGAAALAFAGWIVQGGLL